LKMMIVRGEYAPWKKKICELQFSCLSFTWGRLYNPGTSYNWRFAGE
jgi:hypothetical protein